MGCTLLKIDAFAERPFAGNPAGVCLLDEPAAPAWMQSVAAELNLPATAFLVQQDDAHALRWFTPTAELELCGHGTLACTHALLELGLVPPQQAVRYQTRSGELSAVPVEGLIWLDFPAHTATPVDAPEDLAHALGLTPSRIALSQSRYLVELAGEEAVRSLRPDFAAVAALPVRGVIVTAASVQPEIDFVSRYFAPAAGIAEDAVTGSAHCALAPYWGARLGKTTLVGYQASARGGLVRMGLAGDRVHLGGQAVTVLRGRLL